MPGATGRNLAHYGRHTEWADDLPALARPILADPQTSGGLVLAVPDPKLDAVVADLGARGALASAIIGRLRVAEAGPRLRVTRAGRAAASIAPRAPPPPTPPADRATLRAPP
jgi:selenide,water dikinase